MPGYDDSSYGDSSYDDSSYGDSRYDDSSYGDSSYGDSGYDDSDTTTPLRDSGEPGATCLGGAPGVLQDVASAQDEMRQVRAILWHAMDTG